VNRAVFLDRDGTLNAMVFDEDHGTLDSPFTPERLRLLPEAASFVRRAREAGFLVLLVTNQPGLAKGTLTEARLEAIHQELRSKLAAEGASLDGIYVCPHHPHGGPDGDPRFIRDCDCRKPKAGLLARAAREHDVDLARSYMVGDGLTDVAAGRAAGCKTILVAKLEPALVQAIIERGKGESPDIFVSNLGDAVEDLVTGELKHPWLANRSMTHAALR
jgi:D-glycero-D-manno-heptose 1,7-bisphosphate phosphatase